MPPDDDDTPEDDEAEASIDRLLRELGLELPDPDDEDGGGLPPLLDDDWGWA